MPVPAPTPAHPDPAPPPGGKRLEALLTAITATWLLLVLPWLLPVGPFEKLMPVSGVVLRAVGLRQGWFMFSKGPAGSQHMVLRVETAGGGEQAVELPPVAAMGPLQAWVDYRYRELEHRLLDGHPLSIRDPGPARAAVARWAALRVDTTVDGPAVAVRIERCGLPAPSMEEARAAGRDADWTARLRDPAAWPCTLVERVEL